MNEKGIFKTPEGNYGYRYTVTIEGKQITGKKILDDNGKPFTTRSAAIKARMHAIEKAKKSIVFGKTKSLPKKTYQEVYTEYVNYGCSARAYTTKLKQQNILNIIHFSVLLPRIIVTNILLII